MGTVFYSSKVFLLFLLVAVLLEAASLLPSSSNNDSRNSSSNKSSSSSSSKTHRQPAYRGAMPQLTPAQCHLAKTQCPTLTGQGNHLDLDPQLLFLRTQYEHSLRRMKLYFEHIIDILIQEPTASPLLTLCANMDEDLWTFTPSARSTASSLKTDSASPHTATRPTSPTLQPRSSTPRSTTTLSSTTPQRTTSTATVQTMPTASQSTTAQQHPLTSPATTTTTTKAVEEASTSQSILTVPATTSAEIGKGQGSRGTDRIPETQPTPKTLSTGSSSAWFSEIPEMHTPKRTFSTESSSIWFSENPETETPKKTFSTESFSTFFSETPETYTPHQTFSPESSSTRFSEIPGRTVTRDKMSTSGRHTATRDPVSWSSSTVASLKTSEAPTTSETNNVGKSDPNSWISNAATTKETSVHVSLTSASASTGDDTTRDTKTTRAETTAATREETTPKAETVPAGINVSKPLDITATSSETTTTTEIISPSTTEAVTTVTTATSETATGVTVKEQTNATEELNPGSSPPPTTTVTTATGTVTSKKVTTGETTTGKQERVTSTSPATPTPTTTAPTEGTQPAECTLTSWSEWSPPVGFGRQVRERSVLTSGLTCPQSQSLLDIRPFLPTVGEVPFYENVERVADNFRDSFLQRTRQPRDILVIVDASGSIDVTEMTMLQEALKAMLLLFCGEFGQDPSHNRLAIVQFSNDASAVHTFQSDQSSSALALAVDRLYPMYGYTCTEKALDLARRLFDEESETQERKHVQRDTLLLTDGHSNCHQDLVHTFAQDLRNISNIFALGIGLQEEEEEDLLQAREEIQAMVTEEDPRRIFSLANFRDFRRMAISLKGSEETGKGCELEGGDGDGD